MYKTKSRLKFLGNLQV